MNARRQAALRLRTVLQCIKRDLLHEEVERALLHLNAVIEHQKGLMRLSLRMLREAIKEGEADQVNLILEKLFERLPPGPEHPEERCDDCLASKFCLKGGHSFLPPAQKEGKRGEKRAFCAKYN
jgi:hypothetical protein